jgi:hypothetical protein
MKEEANQRLGTDPVEKKLGTFFILLFQKTEKNHRIKSLHESVDG